LKIFWHACSAWIHTLTDQGCDLAGALSMVDFASLNSRLRQNSVQEKLTALWIKRCLAGINTA